MKMKKIKEKIQKLSKKTKIIIFSIVISIVTLSALLGMTFFFLNKDKKTNNDAQFVYKLKADDIFPQINYRDYYHLIEIENQKPIISENMISTFIKDIISKLGVSYGDIDFNFWKENPQSVYVEFIWNYQDEKISKNYHLKLNTNI